jgi:radical SAM superfamily enzyme YgiQ (UPF0313 family)
MLREMAKAGCKILYFGIESANQRILDYYNKKITPEQSEKAVKTARKAGIDVIVGSFILGAPDETRSEINNTIEFAKRIPIDIPQFNILDVHPGQEMWNELEARGILNAEEYWETGVPVSKISPKAVPFEEIRRMTRRGFYSFIRRPTYIAEQIARMFGSPYRMNVLLNNLSQAGNIIESAHSVA